MLLFAHIKSRMFLDIILMRNCAFMLIKGCNISFDFLKIIIR